MVKLAEVRIRPEPYYRREAIEQGLKRSGYTVGRAGANPPWAEELQ